MAFPLIAGAATPASATTNGRVALASGGDIYTSEPDGTGVVHVTSGTATDFDPAISPDGSKVSFASDRDHSYGEIYVTSAIVAGGAVTRLTNDTNFDWQPAWSPDGTAIAWAHDAPTPNHPRNFEIYVMNPDGSGKTNLTKSTAGAYDIAPTWSSDGKQIAFSSDRDGYGCTTADQSYFIAADQIYVMNADGSSQHRVLSGNDDRYWEYGYPDWYGTTLAFSRATDDASQDGTCDNGQVRHIYKGATSGSGLTDLGATGGSPSWSTDGSMIAYDTGNSVAFITSSGGSAGLSPIAGAGNPDWQTQAIAAAPVITLSKKSGAPGTNLSVSGANFGPNERVRITFTDAVGTLTVLAKPLTDGNGAFGPTGVTRAGGRGRRNGQVPGEGSD